MKKMLFLTILSAFFVFSSIGDASAGWSQSSVTLKPGENASVEFQNPDNTVINLTIENIAAPGSLLPFVIVSPTTIDRFDNENVSITFANVPQSIREGIAPDVYPIKIAGLVVYLDMTMTSENEEFPENIEFLIENLQNEVSALKSQFLALQSQMNSLSSSLNAKYDNLAAKISELENVPSLAPQIENLWAELALLKTEQHGNPDSIENWFRVTLNDMQNQNSQAFAQLRMDYEGRIADLEKENNVKNMVLGVAIVMAFGLIFYFKKPFKFKDKITAITAPKPEDKTRKSLEPEV